ncbi:hypothetical protein TI05_01015 [Achromatium sp. WMS3]|nr:hypothetical protein TI05_01015 [Achromatium sp. WMS3]
MVNLDLNYAVTANALRPIDAQLANHLSILTGEKSPEVLLAAALVSQRIGVGDVCLDLENCQAIPFFQLPDATGKLPKIPPINTWHQKLINSPLVGTPHKRRPLILDQQRLYLERYWQFENKLATALEARLGTWNANIDPVLLITGLERLFPPDTTTAINWQKIAAAMAVLRPFCVISGGPGTGKTHTVTAILALLIEQAFAQSSQQTLRIALGVPTGKAAARLTQSIRERKKFLPITAQVAAAIPDEAVTLHRLLKFRPGHCEPIHGPELPLPLDILVVDEASMLDLPMMARVLAALPKSAHLILLGDRHQLASVEVGTVLGDLCGRTIAPLNYNLSLSKKLQDIAKVTVPVSIEKRLPIIADHQVVLQKSHRFKEKSGIGALARAVNAGNGEAALNILADPNYPDVVLIDANALADLLRERMILVYSQIVAAPTAKIALEAFNELRVLCAVREGPYGVTAMNRLIEKLLVRAGLLQIDRAMYSGRPLMITANDYNQRLYNGDIGLVFPDPKDTSILQAYFDTQEGVRHIFPTRVPAHESVYAMTVHKSQGSEFDQVILVLPEAEQRILNRELIYTGLTRAKKQVLLVAKPEIITKAIARVVTRASGLFTRLWQC